MRRLVGLLALGGAVLLAQGTLAAFAPGFWLPDLVFLYAVGLAIAVGGVEALVLAAALGYAADLFSGALLGQHALLLVLVCGATRIASLQLHLARSVPRVAFVAGLTVLYVLGHAALARLFVGASGLDWSFARQLAIQTGLNALLAPLVVAGVARVSGWLAPDDEGFRRGLAVEPRSRGL